ncbi:hypothetical protein QA635_08425 [Bradyrhizobium brasilense]|uniref:hypothetical protein n=1 Tax=Bradyrhizobium brasilense TaxID=1419277 RepID=UPI0024B16526|nr:hypothetical protein [Bradyrhizobium australafricanum]WFU34426.1 hypothetical protein QA635_08425 [Bradyrhizobium australafricanum]
MDALTSTAVETEYGHRIAMHIDGVATPRSNEPMTDLVANVRLTTAAPKYDWVNKKQIWGLATVNLETAKIHDESFMQ